MKMLKEVALTVLLLLYIALATADFMAIAGEMEDATPSEFFTFKAAALLIGYILLIAGKEIHVRKITPEWYRKYINFMMEE